MSQRLIDAEALKEFISDMQVRGGNAYYHKGMNDALHEAFPKFIDEQPTIDPETLSIVRELREKLAEAEKKLQENEPVHAHWISYHEADFGWDEYGVKCSHCKRRIERGEVPMWALERCPYCDAKMDEED